jgi:hypothetical protein
VVDAFRGEQRARRQTHLGDPPFRGVYLRLAEVLPMPGADDLREQFILYAASSGDHSTSDAYIQALEERKRAEVERSRHAAEGSGVTDRPTTTTQL